MYSVKASVLLIVLLVARLAGAQASPWRYDIVKGGTCKALVQRMQTTGVTEASGKANPGKWAVTASTLFMGTKRADAADAFSQITYNGVVQKTKTSKGTQTCVVLSNVAFNFRAEHEFSALDWQHGGSANSKCAKEWQRVNGDIHAHEPLHAADMDNLAAAANKRALAKPLKGCGKDQKAAETKIRNVLAAEVQKAAAGIRADAEKKAKIRDVQTTNMTCPCEEPAGWKLEFDVTVKGKGSRSDKLSNDQWTILQKYAGSVDLTQQATLPSAAAQARMLELSKNPAKFASLTPAEQAELVAAMQSGPVRWTQAGQSSIPLVVEIDNTVSSYAKEPGEADSYEATKKTMTWKGSGKDTTGVAILVLDAEALTYDLDFDVAPVSPTKQVDKQTKTVIDRTKFGFGDLPTHEEPPLEKSKAPFGSLKIPSVKEKLNGLRVTYKARPFKAEDKVLEFEEALKPSEPLELGQPQPDKVKVHIHYRLTQLEPK